MVEGEALEQVWGNLPLSSASVPTVWVQDEDVARAAPIVEEFNRRHIENQERGDAQRLPSGHAVPRTDACHPDGWWPESADRAHASA